MSLIDLKSKTPNEIYSLFEAALQLKKQINSQQKKSSNTTAALLFFEPSTRTRFSFETGCVRAGVHPLILDGASGTSLEKGETLEDTILNIEAMKPLFFVIRAPDSLNLREISQTIKTPIINAGWGKQGHPTQALLDAVTVFEKLDAIENKKILFVGDIKHSRVVSSHLELAKVLKYKIAFCCPKDFLPAGHQTEVTYFDKLVEGLHWADAVVALRVQTERHEGSIFSLEDYKKNYSLNSSSLANFKKEGLILHPGPINYGVELEKEILNDSRSVILQLVENGTYIREALIQQILRGTL